MDTNAKPVSPQLQVTVFNPRASSSSYHVGPRPEHFGPGTFPTAAVMISEDSSKKKRGRPRKYKPEGSSSTAFSPMPISSSVPPGIGKSYVEVKTPSLERPIDSERKYRNKVGAEKLDEFDDCLTGSSFLPHVITVNTGEDISTKIMEFSQRGPRSVCVICGNGMVSNVTIRHPSSSRGTCTYEGLFEILSFTGSFNPVEIPDPRFGRHGTMTISLAGADGRVVGGFIGGLTIAASPIKVIVASFLLESPIVLKTKKPKTDTPYSADGSSPGGAHALNLEKRIISFNNTQSENPTTTTNWDNATQTAGTSRKPAADINISLHG